jgi:hypothetical protein
MKESVSGISSAVEEVILMWSVENLEWYALELASMVSGERNYAAWASRTDSHSAPCIATGSQPTYLAQDLLA